MNSINPTMSSALMSLQSTQNLAVNKPASVDTQNAGSVNAAASTTVTLGSSSNSGSIDYMALNPQQTVQSRAAASQSSVNANQTSSGLTYAASLQNQANYMMNETSPMSEERGERNS